MKLTVSRQALLGALQAVIGVVERRQTMPILANILMQAKDDRLAMTATDIEVELQCRVYIRPDTSRYVSALTTTHRKIQSEYSSKPVCIVLYIASLIKNAWISGNPSLVCILLGMGNSRWVL